MRTFRTEPQSQQTAIRLPVLVAFLSCLIAGHVLAAEDGAKTPSSTANSEMGSDDTKAKIAQFLGVAKELKTMAGTPGAAFAIVSEGELIYRGCLGFADIENEISVQPDTLFAAGSCTKAITGFAAAQLIAEGKLSWEDRATELLPEFRLADEYVTRHVRLRDMFTHTTGLARHDQLWLRGDLKRDQILDKLPYLELGSGLRERYEYNNLMFTLAGLAAARAGETNWDQLIRERAFTPLRMNASLTTYDEFVNSPNRSTGYDPGGIRVLPHRNVDVVGPAGSVTSTIQDMSHWLLALTNAGQFEGMQTIDLDAFNDLTAPQATIDARQRVFYGIGWEVLAEQGQRVFQHGGGIDGQNCYVKVLPDAGFGIVIFANHQSDFDDQLAKYASQIFVHGDLQRDDEAEKRILTRRDRYRAVDSDAQQEPASHATESVTLQVNSKHRCRHPLESYTGRFRHGAYGEIRISRAENGQFNLVIGDVDAFLRHRGYEYFEVHTGPGQPHGAFEIGFRSGQSGEVTSLVTKFEFGSPDLVFRRVSEETVAANSEAPPKSIIAATATKNVTRKNVLRSNKLDITYRIGRDWPSPWKIMPDVSLDRLEVACEQGRRTFVVFESDVDKRRFSVIPDETVSFDILLPDGKVAKTELVGTNQ